MKLSFKFLGSLLTILAFSKFAISQITFEPGYIINSKNERINCLIKNLDWENNPEKFQYKFNNSNQLNEGSLDSIKEFGILNTAKFVREEVDIDISGTKDGTYSNQREPIFEKRVVFLKTLVEGSLDLYYLKEGSIIRFFWGSDDQGIDPLVYKKYVSNKTDLKENNYFRQQLQSVLNCENITSESILKTDYKVKDLTELFIQHNQCSGKAFKDYSPKKSTNSPKISIRPGITYSRLAIQSFSVPQRDFNFENQLGFRIGLELEWTLPFNRNKWSIIMEPSYRYFKGSVENENLATPRLEQTLNVDYHALDIPLGFRYSIYSKSTSNFFLNGLFILGTNFNPEIVIDRTEPFPDGVLDITAAFQTALGIGFDNSQNLSFEFRYLPKSSILKNHLNWSSQI